MNEKLLKIKKKLIDIMPYLFFTLVMIVYHYLIKINFGDEITYFGSVLANKNEVIKPILDFSKMRYLSWSSRQLIEFVLVLLSHYNPIIWKVLDILIWILCVLSIVKIVDAKDNNFVKWAIAILVLTYPFFDMSSAGWMATTTNYLWPLSIGLYALSEIRDISLGKIKIWRYIAALLALIFAVNCEQMAGICLMACCLMLCESFFDKKKWYLLIPYILVCLISITYILRAPGNKTRSHIETLVWMTDFENFSLTKKLYAGYGNMTNNFLYRFNETFLIFIIALSVCLFIKFKEKNSRWLILAISGLFVSSYILINKIRPVGISDVNTEKYASAKSIFLIFGSLFVWAAIIVGIWIIANRLNEKLDLLVILGSGAAASIILGFSPTIYVSGERIFIFQYFCFFIATAYLLRMKNNTFITKILLPVIAIAALYNIRINIIFLLSMIG